MKRLLCCCLTIIAAITMMLTSSSCGEEVISPVNISLTTLLTPSGAVVQQIDFSLQTENLKQVCRASEQVLEVQNNFSSALTMLRNEFYLSFLLIYSLHPSQEYKIGQSVVVSDVFYDGGADAVGFNIVYKDVNAYAYFQSGKTTGRDEEANQSLLGREISPKFLERVTTTGKFPFAGQYTDSQGVQSTVGERYLQIYRSCFNLVLSNEDCDKLTTPNLVYDYASPYSNVRTDADVVKNVGGIYHNIWVKSPQEFKDSTITITSTAIYPGWWYLSLLLAVIGVLAVVWVIVKVKNR